MEYSLQDNREDCSLNFEKNIVSFSFLNTSAQQFAYNLSNELKHETSSIIPKACMAAEVNEVHALEKTRQTNRKKKELLWGEDWKNTSTVYQIQHITILANTHGPEMFWAVF